MRYAALGYLLLSRTYLHILLSPELFPNARTGCFPISCCIIFVPFLFFVIVVVWLALWIVLLVFLYASGEFQNDSKIFASFKQLYIDATFKVTPKLFYQTLIIIAKDSLSNLNIPCFYIPMSNKKLETYNKIFSTLFDILKIENIKYEPKSIKITCDFELNLENLLNLILQELI